MWVAEVLFSSCSDAQSHSSWLKESLSPFQPRMREMPELEKDAVHEPGQDVNKKCSTWPPSINDRLLLLLMTCSRIGEDARQPWRLCAGIFCFCLSPYLLQVNQKKSPTFCTLRLFLYFHRRLLTLLKTRSSRITAMSAALRVSTHQPGQEVRTETVVQPRGEGLL